MPNWTANIIRALGTPEDLRAFLEAVKWEDRVFDFNRVIPMPELLRHTGKGCRVIDGERVESWYVIDHTEPLPKAEHLRRFSVEEEAILNSIGHRDWYDWSCENWGTKWNASHPSIDAAGIAYGYAEISFQTAWAPPMPVFRKMFALFPQISFVCVWEHEDDSERHSIERIIGKRGEG